MQVQPLAETVGVDGPEKKMDFPLKFCTVCASNQNRFVASPPPLSLSPDRRDIYISTLLAYFSCEVFCLLYSVESILFFFFAPGEGGMGWDELRGGEPTDPVSSPSSSPKQKGWGKEPKRKKEEEKEKPCIQISNRPPMLRLLPPSFS